MTIEKYVYARVSSRDQDLSIQEATLSLRATEQPIDTSNAMGKCFFDMLGVFAEFETNLRKERQLEGIAKAKAAGVYKGRKRKVPIDEVRQLKEAGRSISEIAETFRYLPNGDLSLPKTKRGRHSVKFRDPRQEALQQFAEGRSRPDAARIHKNDNEEGCCRGHKNRKSQRKQVVRNYPRPRNPAPRLHEFLNENNARPAITDGAMDRTGRQ